MLQMLENEPEHWELLMSETVPILKMKLAVRGIEAFSHDSPVLFKKYLEQACAVSTDASIPNLYRFMVGVCCFVQAMREADVQMFHRFLVFFRKTINEEKTWRKTYYYIYNLSVLCNNIGTLIKLPLAHLHSIHYLINAVNLLNANTHSSFNIKKSHKLLLSSIGVSYTELKEYKLAHQYLSVAEKSAEQENYTESLPLIYIRFGTLLLEMQDNVGALNYFEKSIAIGTTKLLEGIALEKKGQALIALCRAQEALIYLEKALEIAAVFNFLEWKMRILSSIKTACFELEKYKEFALFANAEEEINNLYLPIRHELYAFWSELAALHSPADLIQPNLPEIPVFQQTPTPQNLFSKQLLSTINTNYHDANFGVESLAEYMGVSPRTLFRKTLEALKESPLHFIRQARLKAAISLLEQGQNNMGSIAARTGFRSGAYFAKIFKEEYGVPPSEYMSEK